MSHGTSASLTCIGANSVATSRKSACFRDVSTDFELFVRSHFTDSCETRLPGLVNSFAVLLVGWCCLLADSPQWGTRIKIHSRLYSLSVRTRAVVQAVEFKPRTSRCETPTLDQARSRAVNPDEGFCVRLSHTSHCVLFHQRKVAATAATTTPMGVKPDI